MAAVAVAAQRDAAVAPSDDPDGGRGPGASLAAGLLGAVVLVLVVGATPLAALGHQLNWSNVEWLAVMVPFGAVGLLVAWRQPRNALGWLLCATTVLMLVQTDADYYVNFDYLYRHGHAFGGPVAVFLSVNPPVQVLIAMVIVLFPSGHLPAPRWKWLVLAVGLVSTLSFVGSVGTVAQLFVDHQRVVVDAATGNLELGRAAREWSWATHLGGLDLVAVVALVACWLVHQVPRYRRSHGDFRLQMKWLLAGAVVTAASGSLLTRLSTDVGPHSAWWLYVVLAASEMGLAALPVSLGVAILRFRLYEIDRVISRSLTYLLLTGLLVGVYVGLVSCVTSVLPHSSSLAVAAGTLVAAGLFTPLRRRLQRAIDRRFNRARYDAEAVVTAFADRLRMSVDVETVRADLLRAVQRALEPEDALVWLPVRAGVGSALPAEGRAR
jgi:hypothetical protein